MLTTTSPFPVRFPLRTLIKVSSLFPFPSVALWISVAKKQTEVRTLASKAACQGESEVGDGFLKLNYFNNSAHTLNALRLMSKLDSNKV